MTSIESYFSKASPEDVDLLLRRMALRCDVDKWVTIGGEGESKGRHVKLNEKGEIVGGDLPRQTHGKTIGQAEKKLEKQRPADKSAKPSASSEELVSNWTRISSMKSPSDFKKIRDVGIAWMRGAENREFEEAYRETQEKLDAPEITSYRGITLPDSHPLAKALSLGKIKNNSKIEVSGMELNSWSEDFNVAGRFASAVKNGEMGIIVKSIIKKENVLMSHRTQRGFFKNEKEIVAMNRNEKMVIEIVVSTATMGDKWKP